MLYLHNEYEFTVGSNENQIKGGHSVKCHKFGSNDDLTVGGDDLIEGRDDL